MTSAAAEARPARAAIEATVKRILTVDKVEPKKNRVFEGGRRRGGLSRKSVSSWSRAEKSGRVDQCHRQGNRSSRSVKT